MFDKEQEARHYGAFIPNRQKVSTLRNQQKQFIENQNAAKRDEFIRQQNELRKKQTMQHKIKKYESIMSGDSNVVSNEYLYVIHSFVRHPSHYLIINLHRVNFEGKGIDVTVEDHGITLMNARNQRNKDKQIKIAMNVDSNEKGHKMSYEDNVKAHLAEREKLRNAAQKRREHLMEQLKLGNVDALIHQIEVMQNEHHSKLCKKPIFSSKVKKKDVRPKSSVHQNIIKEIKNKKRKLENRPSTENEINDNEEPLVKKFKSQRVDKDCGYAAIPPPDNLYKNSRHNDTKSNNEAFVQAEHGSERQFQNESNVERKEQFIPTAMPNAYPQGVNQNYAYNQYMHQYNMYMHAYHQNMAYQNYQYQCQQNMAQYPYQTHQPLMKQSNNSKASAKTNTEKGMDEK